MENRYIPAVIRTWNKGDEGFVYNSWLSGLYTDAPGFKFIYPKIFYENHKLVLSDILIASEVLIACNPDDHEQIFGYIVCGRPVRSTAVIHYLYVKYPYRKLGIAGELFNVALALSGHLDRDKPAIASHIGHPGVWFDIRKKLKMVYNPYILREVI